MQTRQRLAKKVQQQCQLFYVDVSIHKPKDTQYYKHKWRKIGKRNKKQQKRTTTWEKQLYKYTSEHIHKKVCKYHEVRDVVVHIPGVPRYMWKRMMKHWEDYIPQRKKSGYVEYRKTHQAAKFLASFPGTKLNKQVTEEQVMRITIGSKVAARACYDGTNHQMIISFYYEPYPFPLHWVPMFKTHVKVVGMCKHFLYLTEKQHKVF